MENSDTDASRYINGPSNQRLWPDSEQILRHQYEISVAESLACSRLRDSRARWIEKIKREETAPPIFRVPFTFASSPLSENLEQGWVADVPPRETCLRGDDGSWIDNVEKIPKYIKCQQVHSNIWNGKLILTARRWRSKQKNKTKKNIFWAICLKIYIFCFILLFLHRLAVRISLPFIFFYNIEKSLEWER